MDVSVIVVAYNQEETIARTLDSILGQDFEGSLEVLVGDDCSSDNTPAICTEYARKYPQIIRYFRRDHNLGVVANYFDCISRARGKFLADCAGDDYWCDNSKLRRQFDCLQANPDTTLVATDWLCEDSASGRLWRHDRRPEVTAVEVSEKGCMLLPILTHSILPHLCSAMYSREAVMQEMQSHPQLMHQNDWLNEDIQILMACAARGKVITLPGVALHYSCGSDTISNPSRLARRIDYSISTLRQMLQLADRYGISRTELEDYLKRSADFMWAQVFHSHDAASRRKALDAMKSLKIGYQFKSNLYRIATSNPLLWKVLATFHKP